MKSVLKKNLTIMVPDIGIKEFKRIKQVISSKHVTEGPITKEFESKFSKYIGVKHAIATTSGTSALELALHLLNIKKNDEVILPSFTHPATGNCIVSVGAKPVFVDIELKSFNTNSDFINKAITKKTKAVIIVSQFGNPVDIKPILVLKKKYNFRLVEDAACSLGSKIGKEKVGKQADITCFSFHPRKIITTGEGGMLVTNDDKINEKARSMKNFGLINYKNKLIQRTWGSNLKLTDIQSAMGLEQLNRIEEILKNRIKRALYYHKLFSEFDNIITPATRKGIRQNFQTYCILLKQNAVRDNLIQSLSKKGIESRIGSFALHLQPAYSKIYKYKLPNSTKAYLNGLAIPLHNKLTQDDQEYVANSIMNVLKNTNKKH